MRKSRRNVSKNEQITTAGDGFKKVELEMEEEGLGIEQ